MFKFSIGKSINKIKLNKFLNYYDYNENLNKLIFFKIPRCKFANLKEPSETNPVTIYEYKNPNSKLRILFWAHMLFIYGNSLLLYFEVFDPSLGYFHGLMLTLSSLVGWSSYFIMGNVIKKSVFKIDKLGKNNKGIIQYKIYYLSFLNTGKSEIINRYDLLEYTQSNIEGFYFVRNRGNKYQKIYINPGKNIYENHVDRNIEFKNLLGQSI